MAKIKAGLSFLKKHPRYFFFFAGVIYQILTGFDIEVNSEVFNGIVDLITVIAFGRVWQKSEKDAFFKPGQ